MVLPQELNCEVNVYGHDVPHQSKYWIANMNMLFAPFWINPDSLRQKF